MSRRAVGTPRPEARLISRASSRLSLFSYISRVMSLLSRGVQPARGSYAASCPCPCPSPLSAPSSGVYVYLSGESFNIIPAVSMLLMV